ncbi:MAG: sulfotransferase [Ardenticatenaceae bacterium]
MKNHDQRGPDFLGIGVQKGGTTWLDRNLRVHPQIWMPPTKTIRYFNESSPTPLIIRAFGKEYYDQRWRKYVLKLFRRFRKRKPDQQWAWNMRYVLLPRTDRWYLSLFRPEAGQVGGEITPAYCRMPLDVVQHIHTLAPQAKIIYLIRNPIDRIWSHMAMRFDKRGCQLEELSDEELHEFLISKSAVDYSNCVMTLSNWEQVYPADQFFVGFFDQLKSDSGMLLKSVYGFLEVDNSDEMIPKTVGKKQRKGNYRPMPDRFRRHLSTRYCDQIEQLHNRFNNEYTENWLTKAREFAE